VNDEHEWWAGKNVEIYNHCKVLAWKTAKNYRNVSQDNWWTNKIWNSGFPNETLWWKDCSVLANEHQNEIPLWWMGKTKVPLQHNAGHKRRQNGYPVPRGINGPPCPKGYKYSGLALKVWFWVTGWQPVTIKNLTVMKPKLWPQNRQAKENQFREWKRLMRWE
jgi:hypothetical protein